MIVVNVLGCVFLLVFGKTFCGNSSNGLSILYPRSPVKEEMILEPMLDTLLRVSGFGDRSDRNETIFFTELSGTWSHSVLGGVWGMVSIESELCQEGSDVGRVWIFGLLFGVEPGIEFDCPVFYVTTSIVLYSEELSWVGLFINWEL
jgi:hypothetical protein